MEKFIHKNAIKCRSFKNYSAENSVADLHSGPWETVDTSLMVEEAWTSFRDTLINTADKHAPMRTKRVHSNALPWLTDKLRALIMQRNFCHQKALKSGSQNDWQVYRSLRNLVTSRIRQAKKHYHSNLIEENKNDSRKLRKAIKSAMSTHVCSSQVQSLMIDSEDITGPA